MRRHAERGLERPQLLLRIVERMLELRHLGVDLVLRLHALARAGGLQHVEVGDVVFAHRIAGARQPLRRLDVRVDLALAALRCLVLASCCACRLREMSPVAAACA